MAQSGDGQTQVVDRSLANRIVARVTDARGRSVPNAGVSFEVVSGGGAILSSASVRTDTAGLASASWRLGTSTAVEQAVRARVVTSKRSGAAAVEQRGTFVSLVAGGDHTCALTDQGAALCWGSNRIGQLGDGSLTAHSAPNDLSRDARFTLAAGVSHTCGLTTAGGTLCWGSNQFGQIGTSTPGGPCQKSCATIPTPIEGSFVGLNADLEFTCGVDQGGVTWCWGAGLQPRTRVLSSVSFASLCSAAGRAMPAA